MGLYLSAFSLFLAFVSIEIDSLSQLIVLLTLFVSLSINLTFNSLSPGLTEFLSFILISSSLLFFSTSSLWIFYISFEFSLVPICLIILLFGYQPEKLSSSLFLFTYTVVFSLPLFLHTISSCTDVFSGLSTPSGVTASIISLSFIVKSPLYGLHSWLPKAHVEAPLLGSMLLSGILLNLGGYGFLLLFPSSGLVFAWFLYLSLLGGLLCCLFCFSAWDLKSVIAYSSVIHIGVVTIGVLSGLQRGYWVSVGIIVAHSLLSPMLFSLSFILYSSTSSRAFVHGLNSPILSFLLSFLAIFCGLNFGLPPSISFWLEVSLFSVIGYIFLSSCFFLVATAFFSFLFMIWFYIRAVAGTPSSMVCPCFSLYSFMPSLTFVMLFGLSGSVFVY